jgi:3-oxoacyl-[acyl-carrier protein] reductase
VILEGKTIWITGASSGIGRATAVECAQQGATVVLSARNLDELEKTQQLVRSFGREGKVIPMDVSSAESIKTASRELRGYTKNLDGLVNCAGILRDALIGMIGVDNIDSVMHTNVYGLILVMQNGARLMMPQKRGSIVNVSSIMGQRGNEGQVVYGASKAAVIGATRSAAKELAPVNIRVNAVAPGVIDTNMTSHIPAVKMETLKRDIKMGRLGTAEEVAWVISFLLSDRSRYVTGQVLGVDGGMWI